MSELINVTDIRSNRSEQIVNAAKVIGRSKQRLIVFQAIYRGKKKVKTVDELCRALPKRQRSWSVRVLQLGGELVANHLVEKIKDAKSGKIAYAKIDFYSKNYRKIISLALDPQKIEKIHTKQNPAGTYVKIFVRPKTKSNHNFITIDEIESFKLVRRIKNISSPAKKLLESKIKEAFKKIVGEKGVFKDWGGEKNDLFSTRLKINNKRLAAAIAFKGKGTKGRLTPNKMGKNGDQIERLFLSPAQVFLIVYCGQIDEGILAQMQVFALGKAMSSGSKIYYGIIDGQDLGRLTMAYNEYF